LLLLLLLPRTLQTDLIAVAPRVHCDVRCTFAASNTITHTTSLTLAR
jgi:hypothetical protein